MRGVGDARNPLIPKGWSSGRRLASSPNVGDKYGTDIDCKEFKYSKEYIEITYIHVFLFAIAFVMGYCLISSFNGVVHTNGEMTNTLVPTELQPRTFTQSTKSYSASSESIIKSKQTESEEESFHGDRRCFFLNMTELEGEVVKWGSGNRLDSAEECCDMCLKSEINKDGYHLKCNAWVYCGNPDGCLTNRNKDSTYKECWLKHQRHLELSVASETNAFGAKTRGSGKSKWTSGVIKDYGAGLASSSAGKATKNRAFHTIVTASGEGIKSWTRIMYFHYQKQRALDETGAMGGFTRILHEGKPDDLMDEIPTFVAKTMEGRISSYPVLHRPYAILQWLEEAAPTIPEMYVLMSEPDHLYIRPMPNFMVGDRMAAFPFFYIEPWNHKALVEEILGHSISLDDINTKLFPIGNSPVQMKKSDLLRATKIWVNYTVAVEENEEAREKWGWVREMYAFSLACYTAGVHKATLVGQMQAQPPWDRELADFVIIHFTYGMDYGKDGEFTPGKFGAWRFDKRSYSSSILPAKHLKPPPPEVENDLVRKLIDAINEATAALPNWDHFMGEKAITRDMCCVYNVDGSFKEGAHKAIFGN